MSLVGIVNPRRAEEPAEELGAASLAQPCWQGRRRAA
jgi:hypothetical protein